MYVHALAHQSESEYTHAVTPSLLPRQCQLWAHLAGMVQFGQVTKLGPTWHITQAFPGKRRFKDNMNSLFIESRRTRLTIYLQVVAKSGTQVHMCIHASATSRIGRRPQRAALN